MRNYFAGLARYNVWATARLLAQVATLDDAAYRRDVGLFFNSIHGTLNHLLVTEHLLWFKRFADGESPKLALNAEAETDRERLAQRLTEGAARWLPFIESLPASRFAETLTYTTTRGTTVTLPFSPTLGHVFNHGTHHRGQISAALTAMGQAAPELDWVYLLLEEAGPT